MLPLLTPSHDPPTPLALIGRVLDPVGHAPCEHPARDPIVCNPSGVGGIALPSEVTGGKGDILNKNLVLPIHLIR